MALLGVQVILGVSVVAAFCPKCGGWTMWHGEPDGERAKAWVADAITEGETVRYVKDGEPFGTACPQADAKVETRTCGV